MTKIALISDIHVGKLSRTAEFAVVGEPIKDETKGGVSLKEGLIHVLKQEKVEMLLVAGDLTSTGSPQEYDQCQNALNDIARKVGISKDNLILSVGNHDVDWKITRMAQEVYASYSAPFPIGNVAARYQLIAASIGSICMDASDFNNTREPVPFTGIIDKKNVIIFVLNSGWCCSHNQEYKHGKLTAQQLEWFKENAKKYKKINKWKIVLLHHHPFNYPYPTLGMDISTLEEGGELLEIAGTNEINLICHGHRHHPRAKTALETGWQQPITFICAGSISVNSEHRNNGEIPNVFHIIELHKKGYTLTLKNYEYSAAEGWKPLMNYRPEAPLDAEMFLGKVYSAADIDSALKKLIIISKDDIKLPTWSNLPNELKTLPLGDLNEKIKLFVSATHERVGRYPDLVVLIRRKS